MRDKVENYFQQEVIPLIEANMPELASHATIQVMGSYALGIADEFSDLDALIYLPDDLWRQSGAQLESLLEEKLPRFGVSTTHPDIIVWPLKFLSKLQTFLDGDSPAWEGETIERLHEVQHCLVIRDPHSVFAKLKVATHPDRFPDWLWRKYTIELLRELYQDHMTEYRQVLSRQLPAEEAIVFGTMLKKVLLLGFLVTRQYYPWQTHLRWAFGNLPMPADRVVVYIDQLVGGKIEGLAKYEAMQSILEIYRQHILEHDLLPGLKLDGVDIPIYDELAAACR